MKLKYLFLIIFSVFVLGCTAQLPGLNLPSLGGGGIISGTDVGMEFIDDQPPSQLENGEQFKVGLDLINKAPYDIDGELCVKSTLSFSGFGSTGIPQKTPECKDIQIDSGLEPGGSIIPKPLEKIFPNEFEFYSYLNPNPISQEFTITASLKYLPVTLANANVCIKKRGAVSGKIVCNEKESLSIKQYPAPIKISKIDKSITNTGSDLIRMNLNIYLDKVVDGRIMDKDQIFDTSLSKEPRIQIGINLKDVSANFECTKDGFSDLIFKEKGDNIIKCSATIPISEAPYVNPMEIVLEYGFNREISKTINLKARNIV